MKTMKIAVTAQGNKLDAKVDPRFGRAKFFIVLDSQNDVYEVKDNSVNLNAAQGAGIQSGRNVVELGVQCIITGNVGPKAFSVLQANGIKLYIASDCTVKEAVEQFKAGTLKTAEDASVKGHWAGECLCL